jgi:UDP-glucose 4-epimerase
MTETILVTGGAGFIGSHLCERLAEQGHKVISLDNYFTGSKGNHVSAVEYREGHTKDIEKHVPEEPTIIYHMGEYSRVLKSLEEPELVWDMNISGTLGVLEFWRKHKCKLVYAGSSTKMAPAREDGVRGSDLAPYTWAKSVMCDLINDFGRWFGLPYAITYFYNVYGLRERSRENYGTLIETFRQNYLNKRPHEVASPGTQTRAFTHVDDTVSGIILAGENGEGDGFSIGAKEVYSLLDVAKMFGGEIVMIPQTKSTRSSGTEDTSKIEALGWKQKYTLKEYIEEIKANRP